MLWFHLFAFVMSTTFINIHGQCTVCATKDCDRIFPMYKIDYRVVNTTNCQVTRKCPHEECSIICQASSNETLSKNNSISFTCSSNSSMDFLLNVDNSDIELNCTSVKEEDCIEYAKPQNHIKLITGIVIIINSIGLIVFGVFLCRKRK